MSEQERLKRLEAMAALALISSLYTAGEEWKREKRRRRICDAFWPFL